MGEMELTWNQVGGIISARFEDIKGVKIIVELNKLRQTRTYAKYVDKLEELKASRCCLIKVNIMKSILWLAL